MRYSNTVRSEHTKHPEVAHFGNVISALGTAEFGTVLLGFLHETCGAEYCTAFHFGSPVPRPLFSVCLDGSDRGTRQSRAYVEREYWRKDPLIPEILRHVDDPETRLIRFDIGRLPRNDFREQMYDRLGICERVMIFGGPAHSRLCLSILCCRGHGGFHAEEMWRIGRIANPVLAVLGKHRMIDREKSALGVPLTSLQKITDCLATAAIDLPRREAEVCARILYGLSTAGIALDLGISEQTTMTYRKRLYHRLGIGSQRELLLWYMDLPQHGAVALTALQPTSVPVEQTGMSTCN
jgi:DNA-binding CsgD family transcriptional regulator